MHTISVAYIVGLLIVNHLILAWVVTNFAQHMWNLYHRHSPKVFTRDDLIMEAASRYGGMGDLWTCPICAGTWIGAGVAFVMFLMFPLPLWFIPLGTFTWAGLAYRFNHTLLK